MILLVDAGNTRTKWAVCSAGDIGPVGVCPTAELARPGSLRDLTGMSRAVVSCVANGTSRLALASGLEQAVIPIHWVQAEHSGHGLLNHYQPPASLGADRYAALIGAARRFHRDCVVVSVGTAMTADMLTSDGQFLGGCIAPGPDLMRQSLFAGTAGVAPLTGGWQAFPRDTGAALDSGVALALSGVAQGMRERLAGMRGAEPGAPLPSVVLSGGARDWLRPLLRGEVFEMENLVLEGLAWIARDLGFDA